MLSIFPLREISCEISYAVHFPKPNLKAEPTPPLRPAKCRHFAFQHGLHAAALTTSQLVAASSRTAPGGGRSHPRLEPGGPTLVVEQLGILLVGGESSQLSQGQRLRCQWTWVTGRSPPLPMRGKELLNAIGQRGDKELRGRAPAGRQGGHNGVELPSEPESGSAGSSSCVMSPSAPMAAGA